MKSSGIGGQAVIEGIMMKNNDKYSIAVRKPNKEIEVIEKAYIATTKKHSALNVPIVRGVVNFIDSMVIGISTLTYSSSFYEEEEEPTKFDEVAGKIFKDKLESVIMGFTVLLSVVIAIGLFMLLPYGVSRLFSGITDSTVLLNVIEGVIRLVIFLIYVALISRMEDVRRVFMYHGAEHKSINCIENGLELNVENVKKSSKVHKRCGTSFMLFVMIISIILFMFIQFDNKLINLALRVVLVPVIAGISYEILKLAGNSDNKFINIISKPGLWLQGLTTKEPDDDMIEVAIAAIEKVFDWKAYQKENEKEASQQVEETFEFLDMEELDDIKSIDDIDDIFENKDEVEETKSKKTETENKETVKKKSRGKKAAKRRKAEKKAAEEALEKTDNNNEEATVEEAVEEKEDKMVDAKAVSLISDSINKEIEEDKKATVAEEADVEESIEDTIQKVEDVIQQADAVGETIEETQEAIEEATVEVAEETVKDSIVSESETVMEAVEEAVETIAENAEETVENVSEAIKEQAATVEKEVEIQEEQEIIIKEFVHNNQRYNTRTYTKRERKGKK